MSGERGELASWRARRAGEAQSCERPLGSVRVGVAGRCGFGAGRAEVREGSGGTAPWLEARPGAGGAAP